MNTLVYVFTYFGSGAKEYHLNLITNFHSNQPQPMNIINLNKCGLKMDPNFRKCNLDEIWTREG